MLYSSLNKSIKYSSSHRYKFSQFSDVTPTLKAFHWLPIFYSINSKICCFTHRALFLGEPFCLSTLLTHR